MDKLDFLTIEFPKLVATLQPDAKGAWGVMNAQQMIEHMSDSLRVANGKIVQPLHTYTLQVKAYKNFAMSDKEFKPNTKNALLPDTAAALRNDTFEIAVKELENEITAFVEYYTLQNGASTLNPFFGELNYEEWIHLLHKHALHHCKQFGLIK